jgi:hypothetical protein
MRFRLIDLIVVTIVFTVLSAIGVKAIQKADDAAGKMTCEANMFKIGKAIQSYENEKMHLPPLGTWNGHPGWNLLILPYMERPAVYAKLAGYHLFDTPYTAVMPDATAPAANPTPADPYDLGSTSTAIGGTKSIFNAPQKKWSRFSCYTSGNPIDAVTQNDGDGIIWSEVHTALATVSEYRDPVRQPAPLIKQATADKFYKNSLTGDLKFTSNTFEQSCMRGAVSDYVTAFMSENPQGQATYNIFDVKKDKDGKALTSDGNAQQMYSPLVFTQWDKYGRWTNLKHSSVHWVKGATNTLIVSEKYIPQFALTGDTPIANMYNGGLHRVAFWNFNSGGINSICRWVAPNVPNPIAQSANIPELSKETDLLTGFDNIRIPATLGDGRYNFGSHHVGVLPGLFGDGSVKDINVTIDPVLFNNMWSCKVSESADETQTPNIAPVLE